MLKIMWKRGEIAPEEQFLLLATIFCHLMSDLYVETRIRFSLRDKRLFEITVVEITRVDCTCKTVQEVKRVEKYLAIFFNESCVGSFWEMLTGCEEPLSEHIAVWASEQTARVNTTAHIAETLRYYLTS